MARGIYKRGTVYWLRYANLDGKTIYESSCSTKFKDAERLLIQRRQEIKEGKKPQLRTAIDYSFKELAVEYLGWAERQKSFENKKKYIEHFVEIYGHLPLRRFSTRLLDQFQTKRLNEHGNKPATVNRYVATIKHAFTKAEEWGMVGKDTLEKVRKGIQDEWALEKGLMVGVVLVAAGGAGLLWAILGWREAGFGSIDPAVTMRQVIPSVTAVTAGLQVMFGAFFLGTLRLLRAR